MFFHKKIKFIALELTIILINRLNSIIYKRLDIDILIIDT